MTARFRKTDVTVEAGLRRIACAEIDRAIAAIDAPDRPVTKKVHDVRQQCKALRALIRLVRPDFADFEAMDERIANIARSLSGARDAKVTLDIFDVLTAEPGNELEGIDVAGIRRRLEAVLSRRRDPGDQLATCRADLLELRAHARRWTLEGEGWSALSGGLQKTYRRARKGRAEAAEQLDPHASHVWRKHVKYHWHHVGLLRAMRPDLLRKRGKTLRKLGELLGERHDIDVFLAALARAPVRFGGPESVDKLAALARRRAARLDRQAQKISAALLEPKPAKLTKRWGKWWQKMVGDDA